MNLSGELEMRNRLRFESQVRRNQEIEELHRICFEEANQVRKLQCEELSLRQEKDPITFCRLLKKMQEIQDQLNSLAEEKEFTILTQRVAHGVSHVPCQPGLFRVQTKCLAAILDCLQ